MTTKQLTRLYFADSPRPESGARLARMRMAQLEGEGLISRLQRRIGGVRAGSAGTVWRVTERGRRALATLEGRALGNRKRRDCEPGQTFVDHTLACSEIAVTLAEAERAGLLEVIEAQAEPDCWRTYMGAFGVKVWVRPDLFVSIGLGMVEERLFIEVDRGTHGASSLRRKLGVYRDYLRSGNEQYEFGVFPRVLWLVMTPKRQVLIEEMIATYPEDARAPHQVALASEAVAAIRREPLPTEDGDE